MDKLQLSLLITTALLFSYSAYLSVKIRQRTHQPINNKKQDK